MDAIVKEENEVYYKEVDRMSKQLAEQTNGVKNASPIIINKNDSMNNRIDEIVKNLDDGQAVLISARGKNVNKSIGIIEIVKTKTQVIQYNKLIRQRSNYHPTLKKIVNNGLDNEKFMIPILMIYLVPNTIKIDLNWTKQE